MFLVFLFLRITLIKSKKCNSYLLFLNPKFNLSISKLKYIQLDLDTTWDLNNVNTFILVWPTILGGKQNLKVVNEQSLDHLIAYLTYSANHLLIGITLNQERCLADNLLFSALVERGPFAPAIPSQIRGDFQLWQVRISECTKNS